MKESLESLKSQMAVELQKLQNAHDEELQILKVERDRNSYDVSESIESMKLLMSNELLKQEKAHQEEQQYIKTQYMSTIRDQENKLQDLESQVASLKKLLERRTEAQDPFDVKSPATRPAKDDDDEDHNSSSVEVRKRRKERRQAQERDLTSTKKVLTPTIAHPIISCNRQGLLFSGRQEKLRVRCCFNRVPQDN